LIWVNSSITNESVGTPNVIITQGSVIVSGVSSCTDFDTDGYNTTTGGICGVIADCNDTNTAVNPGATEVCTDGIDNNCNGESGYDGSDGMHGDSVCVISFFNTGILPEFTFASVVENTQFDFRCFIDPIMQTLNDVVYADFDGNSCSFDKWQTYAYYFTCNSGSYTGSNKTARCFINDTNSYYTGFQSVSLEFEVTQTPPNCIDNDGDGYNTTASAECGLIDEIDCDDNNINVNPGAIEVCDGVDNDCQGVDSNPNGICTYLSNLEPDAFICVLGVCECSTTYEEDNPELAWINGANCNGCVDQTEITNYANDWLNGESEIGQIEITTAVDNWINVVSSCP